MHIRHTQAYAHTPHTSIRTYICHTHKHSHGLICYGEKIIIHTYTDTHIRTSSTARSRTARSASAARLAHVLLREEKRRRDQHIGENVRTGRHADQMAAQEGKA